jgi:hypothetical protein
VPETPSGPRRRRPVARAQCQARRSGSVSGSVASARARWTPVAIVGGSQTVGGGSGQRMDELDAPAPGGVRRRPQSLPLLGRPRGSRPHGGAARRRPMALRRRRGRSTGSRRGVGGGAGRSSVRFAGDLVAIGQPKPAGEGCGVPGSRKLEEGERVAMTLGDDLVADRGVQRPVQVAQ